MQRRFRRLILPATLLALASLPASAAVSYTDKLVLTSADGTPIAANLFLPDGAGSGKRFPAVLFINSWTLDEHEYTIPAKKLADAGYIVLSYSARGWGQSGGYVRVAGPEDVQDFKVAVDYLVQKTPSDGNIGSAGISYGAGISLLGMANDPRVKTVAAMSGWASLSEALYMGETPNLTWSQFLYQSGRLTAHLDNLIPDKLANLYQHQNIGDTLAWAGQRSAETFLAQYNARRTPIYLSQNYNDELFKPNDLLNFYSRLAGPKKIDLNKGMHAIAEVPGLAGLPNYTWSHVYDWFDYWLKGKPNGILAQPPVSMAVKFSSERTELDSWPSSRVSERTLYLGPGQGLIRTGSLSSSANGLRGSDTIQSGYDSGASAGVPVLSSLAAAIDVPVLWSPVFTNRKYGAVYQTARYGSGIKVRGNPKLNLRVVPSGSKAQLVAYLYSVDALGIGTLQSYGSRSLYEARPGAEISVPIELATASFNLPAGQRLAVVIDTFDLNLLAPTKDVYQLSFRFDSAAQSILQLPVFE